MRPSRSHLGSVADCVESSENPEKSPMFADPPPGLFFGEGTSIAEIPTRSAEIRRNRQLHGAVGRNFAPCGSAVDCVGLLGKPGKSHLFADPPPDRFCGEGSRFSDIPTRSADGRRNRHVLVEAGRNFVTPGCVCDCVESSGNPETAPLFDDPPPDRFCGEGAIFRGIPPDRPRYGEIATYLVRISSISHIMDQWSIVGDLQGSWKISAVRGPAAHPGLR